MAIYFSKDELSCKCGCGFMVTDQFARWLDDLRDLVGLPLTLNCSARCPVHNSEVGGAKNSQHLLGLAADIQALSGALRYKVAEAAFKLGVKGISFYSWGVHVDLREGDPVAGWET